MDKKRIGIYYNVSDSWIGGKYYLDGIINALKQNPNNEIIYLKRTFFFKVIGRLLGRKSKLFKRFYDIKNKKLNLDVVFPYVKDYYSGRKNIHWIPDFQENYYPELFEISDICRRLTNCAKIAYSNDFLILSSESAKKDFERLFPKHTCKVAVLSFISSLYKDYKEMEYEGDVKIKYNIGEPYYICSNQLWQHKNHIVVLNAINEIKKQGKHILCLFTGKEEDYRNPGFPELLKSKARELNLEKEVRFLGFIPRIDQVELMKQSVAVIQPSLFEGWNTTIEDAKFYHKLVIASSIPVHKEQLSDKGIFFDIDDYKSLSQILLSNYGIISQIDYDYEKSVKEYIDRINRYWDLD